MQQGWKWIEYVRSTLPKADTPEAKHSCPLAGWPWSNERNFQKTRKYLKEKVVISSVQSLVLNHYPVDLLKTFYVFENGQIWTCWCHFSKQFCAGTRRLKVKKPVQESDLAHVFTSLWMKSPDIKRKTARDVWPWWSLREVSAYERLKNTKRHMR